MNLIDTWWLACATLVLTLPGEVLAQAETPHLTAAPAAVPSVRTAFDQPVSVSALNAYRGTGVVHSDMQLSGTTAGNTAVNVATGTNAIAGGAFSNMSGLPVVIQNSGANVLIQNAVILNLQMN